MIDLPLRPAPASATPFFIDAGGILKGGLGASDQRYNRLGSRFGLHVMLPPMKSAKVGRQWVAALIMAKQQGARMRWPLQGFDPSAPGAVQIDGAGQAGSTLNVKNVTPGYVFRLGQFFSIDSDGHCLYPVGGEVIAADAGTAAVPLGSPIRVQHADNDSCHFGRPMIEGFVQGDELQWNWAVAQFTSIEFEIRERR